MRVFGSKVIALNKESQWNKFEPKVESYLTIQKNQRLIDFRSQEQEK